MRIAVFSLMLICLAVGTRGRAAADNAGDAVARGREILATAQRAAGGIGRLSALRDVTRTATRTILGGKMTATQVTHVIFPGVLRNELILPAGRIVVFLDGDHGRLASPQGAADLSGQQVREAKGALLRQPEELLLSDRRRGCSVKYLTTEQLHDGAAHVIEVTADGGLSVSLWIEEDGGELAKIAYEETSASGQKIQVEEFYSNYRAVDGIRTPFRTRIFQDGRVMSEISIQEVKYNQALQPKDLAELR